MLFRACLSSSGILTRLISSSCPARHAEPRQQQQQQQQHGPSSSSAAEPATSFIVNTTGTTALPAAAPLSPTAGGVLAGAAAAGGVLKEYSMRQVSKHATDDSCWIVVNGKVGKNGAAEGGAVSLYIYIYIYAERQKATVVDGSTAGCVMLVHGLICIVSTCAVLVHCSDDV